MAKKKFPLKLHPSGSLARRVVFICLSLLVIPLFLHSLFLYQKEYRQKLHEAKQILGMIGEGEKVFLAEKIKSIWKILDVVFIEGNYNILEQFKIFEIPLPKGVCDHFAIFNQKTRSLFIGRETTPKTALSLEISYQTLHDQLVHFETPPYPISLAFVGADDQIFAGTVPTNALSLKIPIEGTNFSLLLSAPLDAIKGVHERDVLFRFLSLVLFIGLIGGFLVWLLTRRITRPLKRLCADMQRVMEGSIHTRYAPDRMGFEINELGKQFNQTLDALLQHQQEAERQRTEREKLAEELRIGHEIQKNLLPTQFPQIKELQIAHGYLPALEVSGDFYDLFFLENGSLFIAIADTAGKGIPACLYSLGLRSSLRSFAAVSSELSEIVVRANNLFCLDAKNSGMFITLWAALYNPKERLLTFCNQGHSPPFLIRNGQLQELTTKGAALGVQKMDQLVTESITLEISDLLFLYTDGVIEAHDANQQLFGTERLREFLFQNNRDVPAQIVDKLIEEIRHFSQKMSQHDDLTVLALRISH